VRLFVAVDVPEAIKEAIESQVVGPLRELLPGARWTRPEGRHLTLKFLGNVDDERTDAIAGAVRTAAARHAGFSAIFADVGGFPDLRRPRVLWIGLGAGAEPMAVLAADVQRELEPLGFEPEDRPFRGHLTLARFPKPRIIDPMPETSLRAESFDVAEVVLFQSKLHPKGARYPALERFPLSG
jgi:2'-5' RNA ligase